MNGEFRNSVDGDEVLNRIGSISQALAGLGGRVSPPGLTDKLRLVALRERQRRLARRSLRQMCADLQDRVSLAMANVGRPMALPVAGGVFCAVLLFSMLLVPTYPVHVSGSASSDVPIMLTVATDPMLRTSAPLGVEGEDVVVEVSVDNMGHMVDYKILSGQGYLQDAAFRRRLENSLLFTQFAPATSFGQRTSGKVRIPFVSSSIIVKG